MSTYTTGGLTLTPALNGLVASYASSQRAPSSGSFYGEDAVEYFVLFSTAGSSTARIYDVATVTLQDSVDVAQFQTDTGRATSFVQVFNLPYTPYICFVAGFTSGLTSFRLVAYYKINSSGLFEYVGKYESAGSPLSELASCNFFYGGGYVPSNPFPGASSAIAFQYPFAAVFSRDTTFDPQLSTVFVLPSINKILSSPSLSDAVPYQSRRSDIGAAGFGNSILYTEGVPGTAGGNGSKAFLLPTMAGDARLCLMFYPSDLEEFDAGTEPVANSFLSTNAPGNTLGLVSQTRLSLFIDASSIYAFNSQVSSVTANVNNIFKTQLGAPAYPFPDTNENYDGSAGSSDDNYYCNPSVYPTDASDISAPWLVFVPRIYKNGTDDDKIGLRVFEWDPLAEELTLLDFQKAQITGSVPTTSEIWTVSVSWDSVTGNLTFLAPWFSGSTDTAVIAAGSFIPLTETPSSGEGLAEEFRLRAWTFNLDGHTFYVIRVGQLGTLVYDTATDTWSKWQTGSDVNWDAVAGINWNGQIVAGALEGPYVWTVDPDSALDRVGVDNLPMTRTVRGFVAQRGRGKVSCAAVRLYGSVGYPDPAPGSITLSYSDDNGATFSPTISVVLPAADYNGEIAWRSLGSIGYPGRVFEIKDTGGLIRIDDAVMEEG